MKNRRIMLILVVLVFLFASENMASAVPFGSFFKKAVGYVDDVSKAVLRKTNKAAGKTVMHADDLARVASTYGDDVARIAGKYGDDAIRFLGAHGDEGAKIIRKYGDDIFGLSSKNRARLVSLDGKYSKEIMRKALAQGDDGIKALARRGVQMGKKSTFKNILSKITRFVKKHPVVIGITGLVIWFREFIASEGLLIIKAGIFVLCFMAIFILTSFLAKVAAIAMKNWIFAWRKIRRIFRNGEENCANNREIDKEQVSEDV